MEDKDGDLFLLNLSSFPSLEKQNPPSSPSPSIFVPLPNELNPSTPSPTKKNKDSECYSTIANIFKEKGTPCSTNVGS